MDLSKKNTTKTVKIKFDKPKPLTKNETFWELERLKIWIDDNFDRIGVGDIITEVIQRRNKYA